MNEFNVIDTTCSLDLPKENLTVNFIRCYLSAQERLWLARMLDAHGEAEVLRMWPSYEVQINFARSLMDPPEVPPQEECTAEPAELTPEDHITILKESVLRLPPSLRSNVALEKRKQTDLEVEEMREQGLMIEIPFL
jgi:hypothetical protein